MTTLVVEGQGATSTPSPARALARVGVTVRSVPPAAVRFTSSSGYDCAVLVAEHLGRELLDVVAMLARRDPRPRLLVVVPPSSADRVTAMLAGADDVVTGPVGPRELRTRLERLAERPAVGPVPPLEVGCLAIDRDRRQVRLAGVEVALPPLRYELLVALAESAGVPVPGRALVERCWDPHSDADGAHLRPQLARLRKTLGGRCEVLWIRGAGYVLRCRP